MSPCLRLRGHRATGRSSRALASVRMVSSALSCRSKGVMPAPAVQAGRACSGRAGRWRADRCQAWRVRGCGSGGGSPCIARISGSRNRCAADDGRDRVAGQAQHGGAHQPPGHQRFAGAHGDLPERRLQPQIAGDLADQVVVADRGAADGDDEIGALRQIEDRASGLLRCRARWAAGAPRRPAASAMAFSAKALEAMIWSGPGVFAGHHQFVPGGDQRDDGAARAAGPVRCSSRPAGPGRWGAGGAGDRRVAGREIRARAGGCWRPVGPGCAAR